MNINESFTNDFSKVCLRNVAATNITPYNENFITGNNFEKLVLDKVKCFLNELHHLRKCSINNSHFFELPEKKEIILPRILGVPIPHKNTKWSKFSKEKDIKRKKRSRLVWDPVDNNWKPRWGKDSITNTENKRKKAIIELKNPEEFNNAMENLVAKKSLMKSKQKLNQLENKLSKNSQVVSNHVVNYSKKNHSSDELTSTKHQITKILDRVSSSTSTRNIEINSMSKINLKKKRGKKKSAIK